MNILQMEDMVKGLPDQVLMQEAQMPSGQIPQFLALSEVQRRQEMRQRLQKPPEATVADQILQGGIASAMPQEQPMGPQGGMPPEGMPPMEPPPQMYAGGMVPYRMYGGGQVPGMVYMQAGQQVPNESVAQRRARLSAELRQATLAGDMARANELRRELEIGLTPAGAMSAGAINQQISRLGIAPTMEAPPPISLEAPDFQIAAPPQPEMMAPEVQGQPPTGMPGAMPGSTQDVASMMGEITGALPAAFSAFSGLMPSGPSNRQGLQNLRPEQSQFDELKADLSPFIKEVERRGAESVGRYEQSIKDIEDRMKKERLGAVLTTLGANLMAGEGALGLEKAGALAQQMGKEARQEISAERRAMESARERSADQALNLQLQQVTSDKEAQKEFLRANREFEKLAFQTEVEAGKESRQARRDAMQLAASLASNTVSRLRTLEEQNALNTRSFINAMTDESKIVLDMVNASVGLKPEDRISQYNKLMASKIRAYGALFPGIDTQAVISALSQDTGTQGSTASESDPLGLRSPR
jgi:hypothetical protein